MFKQFYEIEDVKTLSNNVEKKFGLSSIYDGLLFVGPEIRGSMALEQAEFQSIVSGESRDRRQTREGQVSRVDNFGCHGGQRGPDGRIRRLYVHRLVTFNFSPGSERGPHYPKNYTRKFPLFFKNVFARTLTTRSTSTATSGTSGTCCRNTSSTYQGD